MKRMLPFAIFSIALFVATAAIAEDAKPQPLPQAAADQSLGVDAVTVKYSLYRIRGDISGDTSLTDFIWEGIEEFNPKTNTGPFCFFTKAKLTIAGMKFEADENGWKWDGKDQPPKGSRVEHVAAPHLVAKMPNSVAFKVGSEAPLQFFRKRPDGLFELGQLDQSTGLSVTTRVEKGKGGRILLGDFTISARLVEKRNPIEGVNLDVGEPVVSAKEKKTTIAVKPNVDYGIQFSSDGFGVLLVRLRVETSPQ